MTSSISEKRDSQGTHCESRPLAAIPPPHELKYCDRYSAERLESLRSVGDPFADTIAETLATDQSIETYPDLLSEVKRRAVAEGGIYQRFLDTCAEVPPWVDFDELETAARMLAGFPLHTGLALFTGSLVGGAVFQKMALITAMTGMLSGDSNRRLNETAMMVLQMALPGTMRPGHEAHETLVRVRLLHGAIRLHLHSTGRFNHPSEVPINQHDLAITLGLLSYTNLRSLARMNITFNEQELAAYNSLWRYAGHIIGIDAEWLPRSIDDQRDFFEASLKHQAHPEKLHPRTRQVMDNLARDASAIVPGLGFRGAQRFLYRSCRYLSGDEYIVGMQLPKVGGDLGLAAMLVAGRASHLVWHYLPGGSKLLTTLGRRLYRRAVKHLLAEKDDRGEYRVRTAAHAAVSTARSKTE